MTNAMTKTCPDCGSTYDGGEVFCPTDGGRLVRPSQVDAGPPGDPLVGQVLGGRYRVIRVLGEGGMGVVYEAEHTVIGKHVALKVLRPDVSSNPMIVERFRQEAKSAARIGHENIIDISDFGETPDHASFLVMEMLEGEDLAHVLAKIGRMPWERGIPIVLQCCKALGAAHANGIVHRDMKPENIFLCRREDRPDFVKIVDFGIAKISDLDTPGAPGQKLTKTGMIFGTPEYMSPEQAAGKPADHRADVYAMGVIMYEMFGGRVPFVGDSFMQILTQHMLEDPPWIRDVNPQAQVPPSVEAVIRKALMKQPQARQASMVELADEIIDAVESSELRGSLQEALERPGSVRPPANTGPLPTAPPMHAPRAPSLGLAPASRTDPTRPPTSPTAPATSLPGPASGQTPAPAVQTVVTHPAPAARANMFIGGLGALLLLVGIGMIGFALTREPVQGAGPAPTAVDAGAGVATPPPTPDAGPAVAAAPPDAGQAAVDPGEPMVTLTVASSPVGGARVSVEGRGEVCPATPCSFQTAAAATITLELDHDRYQGTIEVTPTVDQGLTVPMRRRANIDVPSPPPVLPMDGTDPVGVNMGGMVTPPGLMGIPELEGVMGFM